MTRSSLSVLVIACALALSSGCGSPDPKVPTAPPRSVPHRNDAVEVGTARADVTMTPGAATFGHALDSRVADGFWTRTYCRVFYFKPTNGDPLVLVPCDLPAVSALLQRSIIERLPKDTVHVSRLMLTATHTHAGVGHFFGAQQYTDLFSSRLPGFDEKLLDELARRIADAVVRAKTCVRAARLSWNHRTDFWCLTRNRSVDAYRLNSPPYRAVEAPACALGHPELLAVDPALDVLRIDAYDPAAPDKELAPIGSLSFFAMHPTVVEHTNQLFGGDAIGIVSRDVERRLRQEGAGLDTGPGNRCELDPLHGVINTNEGDIAPIWATGNIDEAIVVGDRVAEKVWAAHPKLGSGTVTPVIDSRYVEENIREAHFKDRGQTFSTCDFGELGQGAARGAADHLTSVAAIPMFGTEPVADYESTACHAPKIPLLGLLSRITRPQGQFPSDLPLAVVQIGDTFLSFVPAEMTITAGHRMNERILLETERYDGHPTHAIVAGLANEYIQYVATEEEYGLQAYEGASTLYGPNSSRYFTNRMTLLARSIFDPAAAKELTLAGLTLGVARPMHFGFGPRAERFAQPTGDDFTRKHLGTCLMPNSRDPVGWGESPGRELAPRVCMRWRDGGPGDVPLREEGWIRLVFDDAERHRVRVCRWEGMASCDPAGVVDDRSEAFRTRIHEERGDGWIWSTLFAPSAATWKEIAKVGVRIEVGGRGGNVVSPAFSESCMPPRCTVEQARLCMEAERTENWRDIDTRGR